MAQVRYYQNSGGSEVWKVWLDDQNSFPMFKTVLSLDRTVRSDISKAEESEILYMGPMYFDLDAKDPENTAIYAAQLYDKLVAEGLSEQSLSLYATGGKGYHITVDQENFMKKPVPLLMLPAIYKELAFMFAVPYMDFKVYTAGKGRMWREPNVQRENGLYKVQISRTELNNVTAASYNNICKNIRLLKEPTNQLSGGFMSAFDTARSKVQKQIRARKSAKYKKPPPVEESLLQNLCDGLAAGAGFNEVVMQIAISAHALGWTEDVCLDRCSGLLANHAGDGNKYDTPDKRKAALTSMFRYMEDNVCYEYSTVAVRGLLSAEYTQESVPSLEVYSALTPEDRACGKQSELIKIKPFMSDYSVEHSGIRLRPDGVYSDTPKGEVKILSMAFSTASEVVSQDTGNILGIEAVGHVIGDKSDGKRPWSGLLNMPNESLRTSNALNSVVQTSGQSFMGSDNAARGMFMVLADQAKSGKRKIIPISQEGLSILRLPWADEEHLRRGVPVWADAKGVITSSYCQLPEGTSLRFAPTQGFGSTYDSDLRQAPDLEDCKFRPELSEGLRAATSSLLHCQSGLVIGRYVGWMVAAIFRSMFHDRFQQFPLLHVYGSAGMGKSSMTRVMLNFHYYNTEPKSVTPATTPFAISQMLASSSSIPLLIDEYKPGLSDDFKYDRIRAIFREAYNGAELSRGGGNKESTDFRTLERVFMRAPIVFVAEAPEAESAINERMIKIALVKPASIKNRENYRNYVVLNKHRRFLGIIGQHIAAQFLEYANADLFEKAFSDILDKTTETCMQACIDKGVEDLPSRVVFNQAVMMFGLETYAKAMQDLLPFEFTDEIADLQTALEQEITNSPTRVMPEWVKVFNTFKHLTRPELPMDVQVAAGREWVVSGSGPAALVEMQVDTLYWKYRVYCGQSREKVYFQSCEVFKQAVKHLGAYSHEGMATLPNATGASLYFFKDALLAAGCDSF